MDIDETAGDCSASASVASEHSPSGSHIQLGTRPVECSNAPEGETDEIVQEIDVYLCKQSPNKKLSVLQYPLRPASSVIGAGIEDTDGVYNCRLKLKSKKVEIDVPLNTKSSAYDRRKGEHMGPSSVAKICEENVSSPTKAQKIMDKQTFSSINASGVCANCYAVGFFRHSKLHLNAVNSLFQMRPTFSHLNQFSVPGKSSDITETGNAESSQEESESEGIQSVRVKFAGRDSAKKRREDKKKAVDEEPWISLRYWSLQSEQSRSESLKHISSIDGGEFPEFEDDERIILRRLAPEPEEDISLDTPFSSLSLSQLRSLPLEEQLSTLLIKGQVLRFEQLKRYIPASTTTSDIFCALEKVAVLVQGCWVVKSEVLYQENMVSFKSGAPSEVLCAARDFILYKLSQYNPITRKEVNDVVKIPVDDLEEILAQLTRYVKSPRGWRFRGEPDEEFVKNHPEIWKRQAASWNAKWTALQQRLATASSSGRHQKQKTDTVRSPTSRQRRQRTLSNPAVLSDNEIEDSGTSGKRRTSTSGKKIHNHVIVAGDEGIVQSGTDFVKQEPVENGVAPEESSSSEILENEFQKFLYEKLASRRVLTNSEIKKLLLVKLTEFPDDSSSLKNGVSDSVINICAAKIGAGTITNPKTNEVVHLLAGPGSWPEAREFLVQFLQERNGFRFGTFKKACKMQITELPSDVDLKKLLLEYCTVKAGIYYLGGT